MEWIKRIIWNVRRDPHDGWVCIGFWDIRERYVWKEIIRIHYYKEEALSSHLHINGRLIGKYPNTRQARLAAESIVLTDRNASFVK